MRLKNILIVVKDTERAAAFYRDIFGLQVILAREGNVILTEGLVLQEADLWKQEIGKEICPKSHTCELYFEDANMEALPAKLEQWEEIEYVTPLTTLPWGQKVIRFYDLDGHLIEMRTPLP